MDNVEIKSDEIKEVKKAEKPKRVKANSNKKDAVKALFMEQCNERRKRAGHVAAYSDEEIAIYK